MPPHPPTHPGAGGETEACNTIWAEHPNHCRLAKVLEPVFLAVGYKGQRPWQPLTWPLSHMPESLA